MGRKKQIDTSMYFCPHTDCPNYGKVGPDNQIVGAGRYGKANTQLLRCKVCGRTFSARRGTPLLSQRGDLLRRDCLPGRRERDSGYSPHQRGG
jgi:transposase-like protein